jgi:uncharacterized protein YndB with AHSA1/START domain
LKNYKIDRKICVEFILKTPKFRVYRNIPKGEFNMKYKIEIDIEAPIKEVFKTLTDDEEMKQWNDFFVENRYYSEEDRYQNRPGTKYTTVVRMRDETYEYEGELIEYNPPYRTVIRATTREGENKATYECLAIDEDTTRVTLETEFFPNNMAYKLLGKAIGGYTTELNKVQLEALKEYIENRYENYNIYDYLYEFFLDLQDKSFNEIENKYYKICAKLAGAGRANKIKQIDVSDYINEMKSGLTQAILTANSERDAKAIYFEYDLDNQWEGTFFICNEYNPAEDEDEDWACDCEIDIDGPNFLPFSELYEVDGFDEDDSAMGSNMYLVARTVLAFAQAYNELSEKSTVPVCIAFHDQDPIYRIQEFENTILSTM